MAYIIIAVILALIILPIFAILPSARQKEQMAMRKKAMSAGVSVKLTAIDDPNPKQQKYISHTGKALPPVLKVIGYRLQRRRANDWRRRPEVEWCLQKKPDSLKDNETRVFSWTAPPGKDMSAELVSFINGQLSELPEDVEQIEEDGYIVTVYWHEKHAGDESKIIDFLRQCIEIPLHIPIDDDENGDE